MRVPLTEKQAEALGRSLDRSRATIFRYVQAGMPVDIGSARVWAARHHPEVFHPDDAALILECDARRRCVDEHFGAGVSDALSELTAFALGRVGKVGVEGSRLGCVVTRLIEEAAGLPEPSYGWGTGPLDAGPVVAWAKHLPHP